MTTQLNALDQETPFRHLRGTFYNLTFTGVTPRDGPISDSNSRPIGAIVRTPDPAKNAGLGRF